MNTDYKVGELIYDANKTGFDEHLYNRHININNRMKEVGVEMYYEEIKDLPRY